MGFTAVLPLLAAGAVNPGSVLDQAHPLLLPLHDSVDPLPWITVVVDRLTVGCCTTLRFSGIVVDAGDVQA